VEAHSPFQVNQLELPLKKVIVVYLFLLILFVRFVFSFLVNNAARIAMLSNIVNTMDQ
jgi:hypothetical protein